MTRPLRPHHPATLDRAAGALVGTAVGDALGAGYEFGVAPLVGPAEMIGGGLGGFAPGEFTDDTAMAVCVAEVAATGADLTDPAALAAVGDRFLDWARSGPPDIGVQTASVLRRAVGGHQLADQARRHFAQQGRAGGNGALMRTAPVALASLGDDERLTAAATAVAELTHAEDVAAESCVLWCAAIDRAVRLGRLDGPRAGLPLLPAGRRAWWTERLDEAEAAAAAGQLHRFRPNGYTVTALQAAWGAICATDADDPRALVDGLQAAISVGDDTDTVAAIAGALLGARWGASAIPLEWQAIVHGPVPGRPGTRLGAHDLRTLAVHSATGGRDDPSGWPGTADLSAATAARWPAAPRSTPLADDLGLLVGNLAGLAGAPADAFVSLCRIGPAQRRALDHVEVHLVDDPDPGRNPNLDHVLADAASLVARWRGAGRTVFLHCVAGQSRTPTVAALVLAGQLGITGAAALHRVRADVPDAHPNPALVAALTRLAG